MSYYYILAALALAGAGYAAYRAYSSAKSSGGPSGGPSAPRPDQKPK